MLHPHRLCVPAKYSRRASCFGRGNKADIKAVFYLAERPVAVLVYQRRKHFINLFIWPSTERSAQKAVMRQGYNLIHWAHSGMTYWPASDLN